MADAHQAITSDLAGYDLDLLFVDDGSTDDTLAVLRRIAGADPRTRFLSFTRNFGFEAAFSAGFRYARAPWILQLDADLQFPPAEARKLLTRAAAGYDAVYGVRERRDDPAVRRWASRLYHFTAERVLGIAIPPNATTFRVLRTSLARRVVEAAAPVPYFMATVPLLTSRYTTVPVAHRARAHGRSKFRLRWLVGHAMDLYFGFSRRLGALVTSAALTAFGVMGLAGILHVAGLIGSVGLIRAAVFAQALGLLALAGTARYVILSFAARQRPALFCVREANFPVAPGDLFDPDTVQPVHTVPHSATVADRAARQASPVGEPR